MTRRTCDYVRTCKRPVRYEAGGSGWCAYHFPYTLLSLPDPTPRAEEQARADKVAEQLSRLFR